MPLFERASILSHSFGKRRHRTPSKCIVLKRNFALKEHTASSGGMNRSCAGSSVSKATNLKMMCRRFDQFWLTFLKFHLNICVALFLRIDSIVILNLIVTRLLSMLLLHLQIRWCRQSLKSHHGMDIPATLHMDKWIKHVKHIHLPAIWSLHRMLCKKKHRQNAIIRYGSNLWKCVTR